MGQLLGAVGQALAISLGAGAVIIFITLMVSIFAIRRRVQGRMWLYFVEPNNDIVGHLYKPSSNTIDIEEDKGKKKRRMSYFIKPDKQYRIMYPPGFPKMVQEPVVAQLHIRGKAEPIDPRGLASDTGDEVLRSIKNVTVLRNMAERAEKLNQGMFARLGSWANLMLAMAAVGGMAAAYIAYQLSKDIDKIIKILGG
jgi:hypothetical protein